MTKLCGIVVHWHAEDDLRALLDVWPQDPQFEIVVVDNGSNDEMAALCADRARLVTPERNLGFAGGVNRGAAETDAPWLLLLNPDARPKPGALEALLEATEGAPDAAGFAPHLENPDGTSQHSWQLRPLPSLPQLLRQALFVPGPPGPAELPAAGTAVEQPAAAALLLRRSAFDELGGFDEGYFPAWHEDVDYALRTAAAGGRFFFVPDAVFVHRLGGSVSPLGYERFLLAYYRNLARFVHRHHGAFWARLLRWLLAAAAWARIVLLPLRKPQRATDRAAAARALMRLSRAALSGFPVASSGS
ncbi:MAG: glycosyltransferase family 2 protein [Acidobacteriota bacterium]